MRKTMTGLLAGVGLMWACGTSAQAQELTIFWAEWDPANYLQELANEYEAQTGVKVTVDRQPAFGAVVTTSREVFGDLRSALGAVLSGVPRIHLDHAPTGSLSLVAQQRDERGPRRIANLSCQDTAGQASHI